ncbi:hypothetical protein [Anaeromusa acidaminophila]|uniref:hypothetical protein n=1 Tax=Anaeromusa acidaminophila TaxID=81464 RepID=UPI0003658D88|nr:hypothetical protein [Anaeromusa acidaminophila]
MKEQIARLEQEQMSFCFFDEEYRKKEGFRICGTCGRYEPDQPMSPLCEDCNTKTCEGLVNRPAWVKA